MISKWIERSFGNSLFESVLLVNIVYCNYYVSDFSDQYKRNVLVQNKSIKIRLIPTVSIEFFFNNELTYKLRGAALAGAWRRAQRASSSESHLCDSALSMLFGLRRQHRFLFVLLKPPVCASAIIADAQAQQHPERDALVEHHMPAT